MPIVIFAAAAAIIVGGAAAYFINDKIGEVNDEMSDKEDPSNNDGKDDNNGWGFLFGKKDK